MLKKFSVFFLLLVLTIQIIPVQQIGSVLFSNQLAEEVPHSADLDTDFVKKAGFKSDYLSTPSFTLCSSFIDYTFRHYLHADEIPQNHKSDIDAPPPNA
ncbi:MAG: hypothetical protein RLZZ28_2147 [Bacteroidota bacterium]